MYLDEQMLDTLEDMFSNSESHNKLLAIMEKRLRVGRQQGCEVEKGQG